MSERPAPEAQNDECDVICPYCLESYQPEACDFDEHEREEQCSECGGRYMRYDEMTVTHHTRPLIQKEGGIIPKTVSGSSEGEE